MAVNFSSHLCQRLVQLLLLLFHLPLNVGLRRIFGTTLRLRRSVFHCIGLLVLPIIFCIIVCVSLAGRLMHISIICCKLFLQLFSELLLAVEVNLLASLIDLFLDHVIVTHAFLYYYNYYYYYNEYRLKNDTVIFFFFFN